MSDMSTEHPVVRNSLTYMNFCAEILCEPAARLIRFQYATPALSRCFGSRSSMATISMSMPARRFDSTHLSSWPITFELHTATSTSRRTAVFRSTSHSSSRPSQFCGHSDASGATTWSSGRVPRASGDGSHRYSLPPAVYASSPSDTETLAGAGVALVWPLRPSFGGCSSASADAGSFACGVNVPSAEAAAAAAARASPATSATSCSATIGPRQHPAQRLQREAADETSEHGMRTDLTDHRAFLQLRLSGPIAAARRAVSA